MCDWCGFYRCGTLPAGCVIGMGLIPVVAVPAGCVIGLGSIPVVAVPAGCVICVGSIPCWMCDWYGF